MSDHRPLTPTTSTSRTRLASRPADGSGPPAVGKGAADLLTGLLASAGVGFEVVYEGPAGRCPAAHRLGRRAA